MTTGTPIAVTPATKLQGLGWFGDGSDGAVVISGNTSLNRDMYYSNLTVNAGIVLNTASFRIFVTGILLNLGSINNDGGTGSNASSGVPGAGGAAAGETGSTFNNTGEVGIAYGAPGVGSVSCSGGGGGCGGCVVIFAKNLINYGTISANGGNAGTGFGSTTGGTSPAGVSPGGGTGNLGGVGGNGGNTTSPAAISGGSATAVVALSASEGGFKHPARWSIGPLMRAGGSPGIQPGTSGASGGVSAPGTNYAVGGSGGGGGGIVFILANILVKGTITANGGTHSNAVVGGTGAAAAGTDGAAGTVIVIQN